METPEQSVKSVQSEQQDIKLCQWPYFGAFMVNFEYISHNLTFLLLTMNCKWH